ncbi:MAG: fumarate reductase/succinate dehydrogenase flavoprotein subunit [Flavobacteriales bacterium]|jgi:succinate dehydrogenase / fumarate reductase flavoprotein subunit|nr:fumarate reductase/succinate dehydrogenase flavoprotein subunit [Flavobacteriales bacterium]MBT3964064.1 fumarate reductase/succinate dehydrogenase flavoprotein subunit [Flavobacteriales bacterium]MBT4704418.1 fumarate reductase/succinate dehydrogenase flavoprotein subunit [Flavobacteriales bacterium]MBT4929471.1 fumarate reductase/succinate dehydrogenase flavoprotein subunit [Flavobacteriales bacterium]MBT5131927.1 fumarate reductase/succinate dehydrogenase flavoprotein subunit [Flavobacter
MLDISEIRTVEHDVLVVGAGGAGLSAAIEASSHGLSTGIVMKSLLGKAHTVMAEGGMAAALANVDSRDHWKIHFRDTMRGGKFLNVWRMAELHSKLAPERVRLLEEWGAVFDRTKKGLINQRNFGGHRYPRLAHVGDRTGLEMIRTLQDHGIHQGIETYMECTALDLVKNEKGEVCGIVCMWRESGSFIIFKAKSIIFATGGGGKGWEVTSNSWEYTGDGYALAYEAGAELMDLEFNQFHPTGMIWPLSVKGILVTESVRGEGGILLNSEGTRFMFNYVPERFKDETADTEEEAARWLAGDPNARRPPELLTRDVVARAINEEVKAGRGSKHGGAYLNIATQRSAEDIKKKLPSMYHQFKVLAELDITKEPMEVGPTCHYFMGGIKVDANTTMSSVPGLFACGECAAGMHGANRLGGNSLSDLLVFGYLSGKNAAEYAAKKGSHDSLDEDQVRKIIRNATDILNRESGANPYLLHETLETNMQEHVGIIRSKENLEKGIDALEKMKADYQTVKAKGASQFNPGWHEALAMRNLLITAEAVARAALQREESRGAHTRSDFPGEQDEWLNYNIVSKKGADGNMSLSKTERLKPDPEMERIAKSTIEDLEKEIAQEQGKVGAE